MLFACRHDDKWRKIMAMLVMSLTTIKNWIVKAFILRFAILRFENMVEGSSFQSYRCTNPSCVLQIGLRSLHFGPYQLTPFALFILWAPWQCILLSGA